MAERVEGFRRSMEPSQEGEDQPSEAISLAQEVFKLELRIVNLLDELQRSEQLQEDWMRKMVEARERGDNEAADRFMAEYQALRPRYHIIVDQEKELSEMLKELRTAEIDSTEPFELRKRKDFGNEALKSSHAEASKKLEELRLQFEQVSKEANVVIDQFYAKQQSAKPGESVTASEDEEMQKVLQKKLDAMSELMRGRAEVERFKHEMFRRGLTTQERPSPLSEAAA